MLLLPPSVPVNDASLPRGASSGRFEGLSRCAYCGEVGAGCDVRVVSLSHPTVVGALSAPSPSSTPSPPPAYACRCSFHARCLPLSPDLTSLACCPECRAPATGYLLVPLPPLTRSEREPTSSALALGLTSRKRKWDAASPDVVGTPATVVDQVSSVGCGEDSGIRTGRWTREEVSYRDALIAAFDEGSLPLEDGTKLNVFLAAVLCSKQSRLTKKMKGAGLSARAFRRDAGCLRGGGGCDSDDSDRSCAARFSSFEGAFLATASAEKGTAAASAAAMRFHIRRVWGDAFASSAPPVVDVGPYTSSAEGCDWRARMERDVRRAARRRLMVGYALRTDAAQPSRGVYVTSTPLSSSLSSSGSSSFAPNEDEVEIETRKVLASLESGSRTRISTVNFNFETAASGGVTSSHCTATTTACSPSTASSPMLRRSAPFLSKVLEYIQRFGVPFEYVDIWVPSRNQGNFGEERRLCYAGGAAAEVCIPSPVSLAASSLPTSRRNFSKFRGAGCASAHRNSKALGCVVGADGAEPRPQSPTTTPSCPHPLSVEDQSHLLSFGDYSQKFSFDVGCGLPGRVFETGAPEWDRSVQDLGTDRFERVGGAKQWGIRTIAGIPVACPATMGAGIAVVVLLYSRHDREEMDRDSLTKIGDHLAKFVPAPKWKLVVDISVPGQEEEGATPATSTPPIPSAANGGSVVASVPLCSSLSSPREVIIKLLGEHMPADGASLNLVNTFVSLRLLLLRPPARLAPDEAELITTVLASYESYASNPPSQSASPYEQRRDVTAFLVRDFSFLQLQSQKRKWWHQGQQPSQDPALPTFALPPAAAYSPPVFPSFQAGPPAYAHHPNVTAPPTSLIRTTSLPPSSTPFHAPSPVLLQNAGMHVAAPPESAPAVFSSWPTPTQQVECYHRGAPNESTDPANAHHFAAPATNLNFYPLGLVYNAPSSLADDLLLSPMLTADVEGICDVPELDDAISIVSY